MYFVKIFILQVIIHYNNLFLENYCALVTLSNQIKRVRKIFLLITGFFNHHFLWFITSTTWMHTSSNPGNGCFMPSEIWNGKNCCFCFINFAADWSYSRPSFCSYSVSYKGISIPGIYLRFYKCKQKDLRISVASNLRYMCNLFLIDMPWVWKVQHLLVWSQSCCLLWWCQH